MTYPSRIVCLTEETTETLYLLGEGDRVVGVSGYTVRPPEARQKPKVSSFLHARHDKIEALAPDLILAFSDLQAEITTELVKRGHTVFTFNQRSVDEILRMIRVLAGIVGVGAKGERLAAELAAGLDDVRAASAAWPRRPRVYFEEWDDPLISGIRWVENWWKSPAASRCSRAAPGVAGPRSHRHQRRGDRRRARRHHRLVVRQAGAPRASPRGPAGRPFRRPRRPIHEVKSAYILQPAGAPTEGVRRSTSCARRRDERPRRRRYTIRPRTNVISQRRSEVGRRDRIRVAIPDREVGLLPTSMVPTRSSRNIVCAAHCV